jgi:glutathione peroxidase
MNKIIITTLLMLCAPIAHAAGSFYDFSIKSLDGKPQSFAEYKNKVVLVVNTASECGYTPQYKDLQALYEKYSAKGLVVLGFPSNDFGSQEPGGPAEIKKTCELYRVKFPLFEKNPVKGPKAQALYVWLIDQSKSKDPVGWNFEKFLVGKDGKVLNRFKSGVKPLSSELVTQVEVALNAK